MHCTISVRLELFLSLMQEVISIVMTSLDFLCFQAAFLNMQICFPVRLCHNLQDLSAWT